MGCTVARRRHGSVGGGDDGGGGGSLAPLGSFRLMDISYRARPQEGADGERSWQP